MSHVVLAASSLKMEPKYVNRLRVTEIFISSYINLSEGDREYVEQFLALQVYGKNDKGMCHYTPGRKQRQAETANEHALYWCKELAVHEPWIKWAKMIRKAKLWEFERREAVREMLGSLIRQKNKSCLNDSQLREAAENALEWTRWDEHNCALARLRNSPEYKSCIEAIDSGENREEALKQFAALKISNEPIWRD